MFSRKGSNGESLPLEGNIRQYILSRDVAGPVTAQVVGVVFFALITGWSAVVRVPLGFTPVPLTLQTLPVLAAGGIMGAELGMISMLLYVLLGVAGFPLFSGMSSGHTVIFGPTGGFIAGFVAASWVTGRIWRMEGPCWRKALFALSAGTSVIYILGIGGLMISTGMPLAQAVGAGMLPFLPGDIIKALAAAGIVGVSRPRLSRIFGLDK